MWMSFTLTSKRRSSHKCLAQGPQELKPALSWPITSASSNRKPHRGGTSLALQLLQWTSTSQRACRDVSWMDMGGNNPKMGHWMPPPNLMLLSPFSCWHQCDFGCLVVQLGGLDLPRMGRGSNSPPLGTAGYPICLAQLRGSSPASATLMLQCTNTLAVLSSLLHFKCTHISTNSLESAH